MSGSLGPIYAGFNLHHAAAQGLAPQAAAEAAPPCCQITFPKAIIFILSALLIGAGIALLCHFAPVVAFMAVAGSEATIDAICWIVAGVAGLIGLYVSCRTSPTPAIVQQCQQPRADTPPQAAVPIFSERRLPSLRSAYDLSPLAPLTPPSASPAPQALPPPEDDMRVDLFLLARPPSSGAISILTPPIVDAQAQPIVDSSEQDSPPPSPRLPAPPRERYKPEEEPIFAALKRFERREPLALQIDPAPISQARSSTVEALYAIINREKEPPLSPPLSPDSSELLIAPAPPPQAPSSTSETTILQASQDAPLEAPLLTSLQPQEPLLVAPSSNSSSSSSSSFTCLATASTSSESQLVTITIMKTAKQETSTLSSSVPTSYRPPISPYPPSLQPEQQQQESEYRIDTGDVKELQQLQTENEQLRAHMAEQYKQAKELNEWYEKFAEEQRATDIRRAEKEYQNNYHRHYQRLYRDKREQNLFINPKEMEAAYGKRLTENEMGSLHIEYEKEKARRDENKKIKEENEKIKEDNKNLKKEKQKELKALKKKEASTLSEVVKDRIIHLKFQQQLLYNTALEFTYEQEIRLQATFYNLLETLVKKLNPSELKNFQEAYGKFVDFIMEHNKNADANGQAKYTMYDALSLVVNIIVSLKSKTLQEMKKNGPFKIKAKIWIAINAAKIWYNGLQHTLLKLAEGFISPAVVGYCYQNKEENKLLPQATAIEAEINALYQDLFVQLDFSAKKVFPTQLVCDRLMTFFDNCQKILAEIK